MCPYQQTGEWRCRFEAPISWSNTAAEVRCVVPDAQPHPAVLLYLHGHICEALLKRHHLHLAAWVCCIAPEKTWSTRTRTRTNTLPCDTGANAPGRSISELEITPKPYNTKPMLWVGVCALTRAWRASQKQGPPHREGRGARGRNNKEDRQVVGAGTRWGI